MWQPSCIKARRGQQLAVRHFIRQVLHDSHALGQQGAVIQHQRGDLPFGVDGEKIVTVFGAHAGVAELCGNRAA